MADVFITGGTGYMGARLVPALLARGHRVRVLVRPAPKERRQGVPADRARRVPAGASTVIGNALEAGSYAGALTPGDTLVHLVGTPHPNPTKAAEFQRVDLPSIRAAVTAAGGAGVAHLVYVSVAHPAPVMQAYIDARTAGERAIRDARLTATVLRPWYVLGPGHRWPVVLTPLYALLRAMPATRAGAERLGLVTLPQMIAALVEAVEQPPAPGAIRVMNVPDIRRAAAATVTTGPDNRTPKASPSGRTRPTINDCEETARVETRV